MHTCLASFSLHHVSLLLSLVVAVLCFVLLKRSTRSVLKFIVIFGLHFGEMVAQALLPFVFMALFFVHRAIELGLSVAHLA